MILSSVLRKSEIKAKKRRRKKNHKKMMNKDLIAIFEYLEREKGIKREVVINAIAESLRAAARKSVKGLGEKVTVEIHPKTGEIEVFTQKKIVKSPEPL